MRKPGPCHCPVRPALLSVLLQPLPPPGQVAAPLLHLDHLVSEARSHGRGRKGGPGHAPTLEHPLCHRAEAVELLLQHLPQALGHSDA